MSNKSVFSNNNRELIVFIFFNEGWWDVSQFSDYLIFSVIGRNNPKIRIWKNF